MNNEGETNNRKCEHDSGGHGVFIYIAGRVSEIHVSVETNDRRRRRRAGSVCTGGIEHDIYEYNKRNFLDRELHQGRRDALLPIIAGQSGRGNTNLEIKKTK